MQGLTQSELGARLGISQPAVSKLIKRGMPADSFASAQAWREANQPIASRAKPPEVPRGTIPQPPGDGEDKSGESIDQARTRLMIADADNAELKRAQTERELLNRDKIERAAFEAARWLRDQLGSVAGGMAAELAGIAEAAGCEVVIRREHRQLLEAFVRELNLKIERA